MPHMGRSLSAPGPGPRTQVRTTTEAPVLEQCPPCPTVRTALSRRRTSSSTAPPGHSWGHTSTSRSPPTRSRSCAASATRSTSTRSQQVYLPLSRLLDLHVGAARRLHRKQGVPAASRAAAYPVRDRAGRLGRGRQVDDGPAAAVPPGALARAPERRADDHRRLPVPNAELERRGLLRAQGLPRVLRPAGAAAVRRRTSSRASTRCRRRRTPTWSTTWCPTNAS